MVIWLRSSLRNTPQDGEYSHCTCIHGTYAPSASAQRNNGEGKTQRSTNACTGVRNRPADRRRSSAQWNGERLLRQAVSELGLSARAHDKLLRVARTIADLAGEERISPTHLSEAIQYRRLDRSL